MFKRTQEPDHKLNELIDKAYDELLVETPDEDRYSTMLTSLERLHKLRRSNQSEAPSVDPNTLVAAATNILGILVVVNYERTHVVASKAFGLVKLIK